MNSSSENLLRMMWTTGLKSIHAMRNGVQIFATGLGSVLILMPTVKIIVCLSYIFIGLTEMFSSGTKNLFVLEKVAYIS